MSNKKFQVLVIMLANTANDHFRQMTTTALDTMFANGSPDLIDMRCVVVETNSNALAYTQNKNILTYYPNEDFKYNRFMNLGYLAAKNQWPDFFDGDNCNKFIVLANNDLVFHEKWDIELISGINEAGVDSGSPYAPNWFQHAEFQVGPVYEGWRIGFEFAGWLQMYKMESFSSLFPLDEDFEFWCADNSVVLEMQKRKMTHALFTKSMVTHLTSASHSLVPQGKMHHFTSGMGQLLAKKIAEGKYE